MTDSLTAFLFATTTIIAAYAAWWLVRHELAVRRYRDQSDRTGSADPR